MRGVSAPDGKLPLATCGVSSHLDLCFGVAATGVWYTNGCEVDVWCKTWVVADNFSSVPLAKDKCSDTCDRTIVDYYFF